MDTSLCIWHNDTSISSSIKNRAPPNRHASTREQIIPPESPRQYVTARALLRSRCVARGSPPFRSILNVRYRLSRIGGSSRMTSSGLDRTHCSVNCIVTSYTYTILPLESRNQESASEKNPITPFYHWNPETRNLQTSAPYPLPVDSPAHVDLPPLHLVWENLQSPQVLEWCRLG